MLGEQYKQGFSAHVCNGKSEYFGIKKERSQNKDIDNGVASEHLYLLLTQRDIHSQARSTNEVIEFATKFSENECRSCIASTIELIK